MGFIRSNAPGFPQVRVFTYLIGREMTFADNVKWIACNNKGINYMTFPRYYFVCDSATNETGIRKLNNFSIKKQQ